MPHLAIRIARRTVDLALVVLVLLVVAVLVLGRGIPLATGGRTFVVGGGSMEPTIPLGSAVVALPVKARDLAVGDVVSLAVGARPTVFTHRIIRIAQQDGQTWLQTKGDANAAPDPSMVPASDVIGRTAATIPYAGYALRVAGEPAGMLFAIALAILLLAAAWLLDGMEEERRMAAAPRTSRTGPARLADPSAD